MPAGKSIINERTMSGLSLSWSQPSWHLLVLSQQWKHQNNVLNLFKFKKPEKRSFRIQNSSFKIQSSFKIKNEIHLIFDYWFLYV